jgi:Outer membrane lipoprotein-sorting protein
MIFRSLEFRKPLACLGFILSLAVAHSAPDADAILQGARVNPTGQKMILDAQLHGNNVKTPFTITVDGTVRYTFQNPDQELILAVQPDGPVLSERQGDKSVPVKPARFDERLRNSGLTYEDVSFQFLYWKNPKVIGDEQLVTGPAWIIEVQAPRGKSQYGVARLWISKDNNALMKMEGYDMKGRLIRRFAVIQVQKLGDQWMLKEMRIELLDPETGKTINRSYLNILDRRD